MVQPKPMTTNQTQKLAFLDDLLMKQAIDTLAYSRSTAAMDSTQQPLETILLELGILSELQVADYSARFLGLPRVARSDLERIVTEGSPFPLSYLKSMGLFLLQADNDGFTVVTAMPFEQAAIGAMAFQSGLKADIRVAEKAVVSHCLSLIETEMRAPLSDTFRDDAVLTANDIERLKEAARDAPTIKLFNGIVTQAVESRATDVHIEPQEDKLVVRFRIDGQMRVSETLSKDLQAPLASRIKILAGLNIAETRIPQDGRIRMILKGQPVDLRISSAPIVFGESLALRILNRNEVPLDLEALGFDARHVAHIRNLTQAANGMFIVTGPTGSGKSTTLYAALSLLNEPNRKLFSIEDPVEYRLNGINQIQVRPELGLDFASVLRSVLRQDPDVIMVGEMRDTETASIAIRASMTGHMVLSTLHTNSAIGTISRLRDMGIENFLLAASLKGILAQRLVRKRCDGCGGQGECGKCGSTGYRGRTVLCELVVVDSELREAIGRGETESELHKRAFQNSALTLHACGQARVEAGITTTTELEFLSL